MPKKNDSYEKKIQELEDIISKMESEEMSLGESISYYEKGIKLNNELYKLLNEAEGKIKILMNEKEEDFSVEK